MKNLLIGITLLILFSCSSNPKIIKESKLEEHLIEKPQINYKLNSLPKDINVIYFSDTKLKNTFPDEIKGLLTNYYSFSKINQYFPKINFFNLNEINACDLNVDQNKYNLIFLFRDSLKNKTYDYCLSRFTNTDSLFISDIENKSIPKTFKRFTINRDEDRLELIKLMNSFSSNIIVIDNEITNDKYQIGEIWTKEFNKEISEYKTLNKSESNQNIFSSLLLLEQSIKRKRKLSRVISEDLDHKSRARQDIDTLYLSVNTQEARSLKPALDFNYFEGMEVFLVNDWVGDIQFLKNDKDLLDVVSIEIPFMLQVKLPDELKFLQNRTRSFAIGYDAFEIGLLLNGARNLNKTTYKGLTGKITFRNNSIQRKSTIFRIKNGFYEYLN